MDNLQRVSQELQDLPREDLELRFMRTLSWYFSEKQWPTGFFNALPDRLDRVANQLEYLNRNLAAGATSQNRLALALAVFTFLQVIVGAVQVFYRL